MARIPVAICGATGTVGQKVIKLLMNHPQFCVGTLVSSERNHGRAYGDVVVWREKCALPSELATRSLQDYKNLSERYVISALPADHAKIIEPFLAEQGKFVFSNASTFRMESNVPLMIPEINGGSLKLTAQQSTAGKIVTNPNCSTVNLTVALAPLMECAKIKHLFVTTLQAVSGAGYPGLSVMDLLGDTIPFISGEEEKIAVECKKILAQIQDPASYDIAVNVHRVPVLNGHTITIQALMERPVSTEELANAFLRWNQTHTGLFKLHTADDRPRPRLDLDEDDFTIHIGRIRRGENPNMISLVALGHNLVRGAAGAALLNLEHFHRTFHQS